MKKITNMISIIASFLVFIPSALSGDIECTFLPDSKSSMIIQGDIEATRSSDNDVHSLVGTSDNTSSVYEAVKSILEANPHSLVTADIRYLDSNEVQRVVFFGKENSYGDIEVTSVLADNSWLVWRHP